MANTFKRRRSAWKEEEIKKLQEERQKNHKWDEISTLLGRSAGTCRKKYDSLTNSKKKGVARLVKAPDWEDKGVAQLVEGYHDRKSLDQIATLLGRSTGECKAMILRIAQDWEKDNGPVGKCAQPQQDQAGIEVTEFAKERMSIAFIVD